MSEDIIGVLVGAGCFGFGWLLVELSKYIQYRRDSE